jgi:lipopolysaccharide transport system permease protein
LTSQVVVRRARTGWAPIDLRELWHYRELFWFLALRDIKVRYKQTVLGAAWAVLQPLSTMVIFNLLFTLLGRKPVGADIPYAVTTFCALLPWQLFANSLAQSGNSLVSNSNLIKKIYFPRLIAPSSPLVCSLLDFLIAFVVLVLMMAGYHFWGGYDLTPTWRLVTLPLFVILALGAALAAGVWLSALNAQYRDIKHVIPFAVALGQFISPVVYETTSLIPERWQSLYALNPMAGVIEGFRWALLGRAQPPFLILALSSAMVLILLVTGLLYFKRAERTFVDLL